MEPIDFEASLVGQTGSRTSGGRWSPSLATAAVQRIAYHHLPPPGAPDANLLRIENEGFGEALLQQYLAARMNGIAVLASG